jgi:hypothetical protein
MEISAEGVVRSYTHSSRQQMARARGLDHKGKGAEALVNMLQPVLFSPGAVARALQEISPAERALLDHLLLLGGDAPTAVLHRLLAKDGLVDPEKKPREAWGGYREEKGSPWAEDSRTFADLVARLGVLGLAYSNSPGVGGGTELSRPGYRMYIPDAVMQHLPPVELPLTIATPPALVFPAEPATLLHDLYVLLSVARERPIPLTQAGQIVKRSLTQINSLLRVQDDVAAVRSEDELPYISFLHALAEELHLLTPRQSELRLADGAAEFLALSRSRRRQALFDAYRATPLWCEPFQIPDVSIKATGGRRLAPPMVVAGRQRLLAEIATLPSERWIGLDHLIDRVRRRAYEFFLPRRYQAGYYSSGYYGAQPNPYAGQNDAQWVFEQIYDEATGWDKVENSFIRIVTTQALRWLGVLDFGHATDERPVAFRVTADGARLLHGEPLPEAEPPAPNVVVQPNFQVFAFEPTDEGVLFRLDQMTERVRLEQAGEYRLSRDSVYRAQRAGWDTPAILQFLQSVSTVPLPQNVRRSIEEWGAELERVVIRRGVGLLQGVDAATLDALLADDGLAPLLGRRVTPTAAIITPANLTALYQRLLERDQMAVLSEGPDAPPYPAFTVDADGRLAFREAVPSIFVRRKVQPFVDDAPSAFPRITPDSLRRSAKEGLTPETILQVLADYHAGPLPPEVPALIRRWAKDWGAGALVGVTLLQVDLPATLADLLADPALQQYLTPLPETTTLAIVRNDGVAAVREALAARGVETGDRLLR